MNAPITITIDGVEVPATPGQTILEAADAAGIYIPRLCYRPGLEPYGGCRVCMVHVAGRACAACTQPVSPNMVVENDTGELQEQRKMIIEMLFVEGNHFCMFCEKSGNCELQALAYRFGITAPRFDLFFPKRDVDASHPEILIDHNRCILCAGCVRASRDLDGKSIFHFTGRGPDRRIAVNAEAQLAATDADVTDRALDVCPVGALLRKREGYRTPVGQRPYDQAPIGSNDQPEEA
ncbi:MAG: 2Fe-2S iron-sulfur cluster binding domain-containing protein [Phycisphaerales bacterium]|nr:2Fe-2S iron-sulfur cluster binding domain-containing protein [Phycisphaerales bacterium]NNM26425.1 2Fe-2S iron-sulfur cluster binding domain-containing protein [Phycisphaerales bacterium]